jgi:predicted hexulose-6-phosphate isomerase
MDQPMRGNPSPYIGIYEKALPSGPLIELLDDAAAAGYEFVEMSIDPTPERLERLSLDRSERVRLFRRGRSTARFHSICLSAHRDSPLGHSDPAVRSRAEEILDGALHLASDIGATTVQVAGYVTMGERTTSESVARYTDALARGACLASHLGVRIGIENQEAGYVSSITRTVGIVNEIGSPYLHCYPDIGNLAVNQLDAVAELRAGRGNIIAVHVKDARVGEPRRVPFGEGEVDFDAAFRELRLNRFHGPLMIEMWNDDAADSIAVAKEAREWIVSRLETQSATF